MKLSFGFRDLLSRLLFPVTVLFFFTRKTQIVPDPLLLKAIKSYLGRKWPSSSKAFRDESTKDQRCLRLTFRPPKSSSPQMKLLHLPWNY